MQPTMELDNREIAIAAWLVFGLAWALRKEEIRRSIFQLVRTALAWRLALIWIAMLMYIALEVAALHQIGLWDLSHLKDTLLWTATVAVVLVMQISTKSTESFNKAALEIFGISVIFDFVVNFQDFHLLIELVLFPVIMVVTALLAVSETKNKEEYKVVTRFLTNVMALIGGGVLLYGVYAIYSDWSSFARVQTAKDFLVPLALSVLFMPFVYLTMLFMTYERYLARLRFYVPDQALRRRFKWCSIVNAHISATNLEILVTRIRANQINSEPDMRAFFKEKRGSGSPPDGFRSMKWGDPPGPDMHLFSSVKTDDLSLYKPTRCDAFLGLPVAEELYGFAKGRLYEGWVWLDGLDRAREVRVRISALYGPPSFANEYSQLWRWKWPDSPVEITLTYEEKFDRVSVMFFTRAI
jgi:hypothetical protein